MRRKKKSCRTKTSQVIAMYRRFYFACGQGVTKNLDRCQIVAADLRFESDLFLQPKTVIVATQKNGSMSWVLGHGPIRPNTFWGVGVLGMFWRSKYILSLRRCRSHPSVDGRHFPVTWDGAKTLQIVVDSPYQLVSRISSINSLSPIWIVPDRFR